MSDEHPNPERLWRWRRRLALWSFACAVAETAYLLLVNPDASGPVVGWSYGLWGSVIGVYIGMASWSEVAQGR